MERLSEDLVYQREKKSVKTVARRSSSAKTLRSLQKIPHAQIDLDALGGAYLAGGVRSNGRMYENLASISQNYARLGLTRFLVARATESRAELEECRRAVGATETIVCRLAATDETMQKRVAERERGVFRDKFVQRITKLTEILDKASIEDFTVSTEGRSVTDVARELLWRAGWIPE